MSETTRQGRPHPRRGSPYGPRKPDAEMRTRYRKVLGIPLHRVIVEQRTGLKLKPHQVVHHFDPNDKLTNKGFFVVCEDNSYHQIIERRGKALRECGHADWWKCRFCGKWDAPDNLLFVEKRSHRGTNVSHYRMHNRCVDKKDFVPGARSYRPFARTEGIWTAISKFDVRCNVCGLAMGASKRPTMTHGKWHVARGEAVERRVPALCIRRGKPQERSIFDSTQIFPTQFSVQRPSVEKK